MNIPLSLTLFHPLHSDSFANLQNSKEATVEAIFRWAQQQAFFGWHNSHNFCEARAEALSLLLEAAGVWHAKAWVFGASFLRKGHVGGLKNNWNYHVAVAIPVCANQTTHWMVIDPSSYPMPVLLESWAASVTDYPHSYHFLRAANYYIFPQAEIGQMPWQKRHHRNFRWAMQGLLGYSSLTPKGKAKLAFGKKKLTNSTHRFLALRGKLAQQGLAAFHLE